MMEAEHPDLWIPSTEEDRRAVRTQLEQMLAHPLFRNSKRYPNFLRHLVEQALVGNEAELKERLLGMAVFHRAPDYDTNQDTVVRLTAGEVRKRIAQYYHEPEHAGQLQIDLVPGSYVPLFRRPGPLASASPAQAEKVATEEFRPFPESVGNGAYSGGEIPAPEAEDDTEPNSRHAAVIAATWLDGKVLPPGAGMTATVHAQPAVVEGAPASARPMRWLAVLVLVALAGYWGYWRFSEQRTHRADYQLWAPILEEPGPVQLVVADLSSTVSNAEAPELKQNAGLFDVLRMGELMNYRDGLALTGIVSLLAKHNKPYAVALSTQASYPELQHSASILIGGLDNVWTLRVTAPLRYHLVTRNSNYSFGIEDRQHPEQGGWNGDLTKPTDRITEDYALVARIFDQTTGRPVLVVAGLGANGTSAAAEFLLDPARLEELSAHAPRDWQRLNMEAVLKTQILDNHAGPPRLVVCTFW